MADVSKLDKLLRELEQKQNEEVVQELKAVAREVVLEAKSEAVKLREEAEKRLARLSQKQERVEDLQRQLKEDLEKLSEIRQQEIEKLGSLTSLSRKEAKEQLFAVLEKELTEKMARRIRDEEEKIKAEADRRAREILSSAMQRVGTENVAEYTIYTLDLPDEDMKGRVIGKEGRNIKAFEEEAGVSVEIGEEGEPTVTISSFDPVRREVAKRAMQKLVADGRIQPTRIKEMLEKAKSEVKEVVREAGEDLLYRAGVSGFPIEIVDLLGRLKFRTSYGQNMIEHTLEVTRIGAALSAELRAKTEIVKKACVLHDIGKAITSETDKGHAEAGAELSRRYNISEAVVQAFEGHHTDELPTVEAVLVYLADAISGARPGARREDYEGYVQRVEEIESVARSFKGVKEVYAISAGREVRVLVNPAVITDAEMVKLAHDISREIHEQIPKFPAPIKVNVVRETKATAIAKPS